MPGKRNKGIFFAVVCLVVFLLIFILASIPGGKDPLQLSIVVKNGTSLYNIGKKLKTAGVIDSTNLFMLVSLIRGGKLIAGEYELRKNMSTLAIVNKMVRGERTLYILQIVEGHNIYDVAETIEKKSIMKKDEFLRLAKDREFLKGLGIESDSLEGYLSPDTYYYSKEIDVQRFIEKIARRTLKYFEREDVKKQMVVVGLDVRKTLILASMIEKEAKVAAEKPLISAVFHNRLLKGMPFDSDPTVMYGTKAFHSPIRKSDLMTYTPYNTYAFRGFPRGPYAIPTKTRSRPPSTRRRSIIYILCQKMTVRMSSQKI
jgi:UPF0755 protein